MTRSASTSRTALLVAVSVLALVTTSALAQEQALTPTPAAEPAAEAAPVAEPTASADKAAGTNPEAAVEEEIVVTGFRRSLENALNIKRDSNLIVESVTAEDIGKFPDQNIAESLQRLPGVQIDRANGQGTKVRIRGLDQNVTLLNGDIFLTGLEIFRLGEGASQNTDSLEGVPSELVGGVDVYKSPNAALVEGGLGGIIDIKTRRPFDLKDGLTVGGNLRFNNGEETKGWNPTGAILAGYNFNDRIAVVATFSYDKADIHTDVLGGENRGNWALSNRADRATVATDYFAPEYRYATDRDQERVRYGGSIGVDFQASDAIKLGFGWFYSKLEIVTEEASVKFPFNLESPGLDITRPFEIDDNGVLQTGTFRANSAEIISFVQDSEIESNNFQLDARYDDDGPFRARIAGSYSFADLKSTNANNDVRYTQYSVPTANAASPTGFQHAPGNPAAPANFLFDYDNRGGTLPSFSLASSPDLFTNPAYGLFKSHWLFEETSELENYSVRADFEYDPTFIEAGNVTITGGARYANRKVELDTGRYLADYSGKGELDGSQFGQNWTPFGYFQDPAIGFKSCELPDPALRPNGCDQRFGNSPPIITPVQTFLTNPERVETITGFFPSGTVAGNVISVQDRGPMRNGLEWIQSLYPDTPFSYFTNPLESFKVEEEVASGYLMADVGERDDNYHLNFGVRIVNTKLTIDQGTPGNANPVYFGTDSWNGVLRDFAIITTDRDYTDILPSGNAVFDVAEGHKVRASAARVVARQNLFQLGRGFQTDFTRDPATNLFRFTSGSAGNPDLEPYRATQFDASYEYYFGRQGLVSVGGFWKEVDSFITSNTAPEFVLDQAGGRLGPVTRPINGEGGRIRGIEAAAQYAFDFGIGFNVNYTYSSSESPFGNDVEDNLPIPGVSEHSFNGQLYYEGYGVGARISYSYRAKAYLGNFGFSDGPTGTRTYGIYSRPFGQFDGQISYQITPQFGVLIEATNILEEDQSSYLQYENLPFTFSSGTRRVFIGGNFKF